MTAVQRFERNTRGRDIAVGDVHGHFTKLRAALAAIDFKPEVDRLFSVGDLVDRGPESHEARGWLLAYHWFHAVQGNHEDMAIRWPDGNMDPGIYAANGGAWNIAHMPGERTMVADAFRDLPIAIEVDTPAGLVGIVHADCPSTSWQDFTRQLEHGGPVASRIASAAQWGRSRIEFGVTTDVWGVHAVVVGHTPVERHTTLGNVHYIDTGAWLPEHRGRGHFTLLDLHTLQPIKGA